MITWIHFTDHWLKERSSLQKRTSCIAYLSDKDVAIPEVTELGCLCISGNEDNKEDTEDRTIQKCPWQIVLSSIMVSKCVLCSMIVRYLYLKYY